MAEVAAPNIAPLIAAWKIVSDKMDKWDAPKVKHPVAKPTAAPMPTSFAY